MERRKTKKVLPIVLTAMVAIVVFAGGSVIAQVEQPDLIITELKWTPSNPVDGETITIETIVKNIGTATVTTDFYVGFYIDKSYYTRVLVTQDLAPGESTNPSAILTSWTVTPYDHEIKAYADYDNRVTESDETNNTLTKNLHVEPSDLIITDLKWTPTDPDDGETITIDTTVKNIGAGKTIRDFYVGFYIDGCYYTKILVTQDLAPGESTYPSSIQTTWTVTPNDHDIMAMADRDNYITESDETNNQKTKHLPPLTPKVSIWTDKEEYQTGEIMQVNIRILNPRDSSITFNWYLGVPKFQLFIPITTATIPAGYDSVHNIPITIGSWGAESFGAIWYASLTNESGIIDQDTASWIYLGSGKGGVSQEKIVEEIRSGVAE